MRKVTRTFILSFILIGPLAWANKESQEHFKEQCLSTREFVTTVEYLRAHKEYSLPEKQVQDISMKVASGCTGASKRFIRVMNLLSRAGLGSNDALKIGLDFSKATESEVKTFIVVFKKSFLSGFLDLDLMSSVNTALSLSIEFKGEKEKVVKDFSRLVKFCVDRSSLDLPIQQCASMAARVTRLGQDFKEEVAPSFFDLFHFIRSNSGPARSTFDALIISEEVIEYGPWASKNFIQAYKYAVSENGLSFDSTRALDFARKMSAKTLANKELKKLGQKQPQVQSSLNLARTKR